MNMDYAILFRRYRERAKLTVKDVSKAIGKSTGYVRNIESGKQKPPTFQICQGLTKVFDLTPIERIGFYRAAFQRRIKKDIAFYEILEHSHASTPQAEALLNDPLVMHCIDFAVNQPKDIINDISTFLAQYPRLPPEKRQALLALCK